MGSFRAGERGSATVEFALTLPIQLLVFLALVQVLTVARAHLVVTAGAGRIARQAAATDDQALIERVSEEAFAGLDRSAVGTSIEREGNRGDAVRVEVTYGASIIGPWPSWLLPRTITLRASAVARQEFG